MLLAALTGLAAAFILPHFYGNHGIWMALYAFYLMRAIPLILWYPRIPRALAS